MFLVIRGHELLIFLGLFLTYVHYRYSGIFGNPARSIQGRISKILLYCNEFILYKRVFKTIINYLKQIINFTLKLKLYQLPQVLAHS